jgi:NAD(P)-dependent dehydrogenase (short-subunit alcohol dehydrogenase family)
LCLLQKQDYLSIDSIMVSPKDLLNDWMHTPLGAFLSYHAWWSFVAIVKLPVSLIFMGLSFVFGALKMVFGNQVVPADKRSSKLVAISGCDTGFGRELAIYLSRKCGYVVLAGCLQAESQESLKKIGGDNLYTAPLDVTSDASCESFIKIMETIISANNGGTRKVTLHALVNNAGVASGGPVDWATLKQYRFDMEVNYFGVIRLTKACLPKMKEVVIANRKNGEAPPRIINITSVAGLLPAPFMSSYCATKHAAEAFTSSLRMEMKSWGIPVVTMNPSFHKTPIVAGGVSNTVKAWKLVDPDTQAQYGEAYVNGMIKQTGLVDLVLWNPMNVVYALEDAVSKVRPQSQYLVGCDAKTVFPVYRMMPTWLSEFLVGLGVRFAIPKPAAMQ